MMHGTRDGLTHNGRKSEDGSKKWGIFRRVVEGLQVCPCKHVSHNDMLSFRK